MHVGHALQSPSVFHTDFGWLNATPDANIQAVQICLMACDHPSLDYITEVFKAVCVFPSIESVLHWEHLQTHTTGLRKKLSANKHRARTVVSNKYLKMFQNKNILKCSDNIFLVLKEKMFISSVASAHWIWSSLRLAHDIDGKALLWWCSGLLPL